jgi:N-acetylglucosaminyldiphosphoundecaprenol N-acetyl-beta-D-mannosaminyltransferase
MLLDNVTPETYINAIIRQTEAGERGYCCIANVHQCVLAHDDAAFRHQVNGATWVVTDSVILQRARALRFGVPFLATMRGADIMLELCRQASARGIKIALIGGRDDLSLEMLKRELQEKFLTLDIACAISPPFRPHSTAEDDEITARIVQSNAQLIFVGLGCPKQEKWMATHTRRISAMMIGVGAAFDFNAGIVRPSPPWVHRWGLEWLYRLSKEPRRLWRRYLTTSPKFVALIAFDALKGMFHGSEAQRCDGTQP